MHVQSIQWHPSGDGDKLIINEGGNDGASIIHSEATDSGGLYDSKFFDVIVSDNAPPTIEITPPNLELSFPEDE